MGSKLKRYMAALLAVMMLVSMVPVSAMATESEPGTEVTAPSEPVPAASDPQEPAPTEGSEPPAETEPEVTVPPATEAVPDQDSLLCHQPGDANSDGEVHVNDAFYVLYNNTLPEQFPMNHSGDYDGDGAVTVSDALLVLKIAHGLAELPEYTHEYFSPVWTWEENGDEFYVTVIFRCSCGQTHTFYSDDCVNVALTDSRDATCTEGGFTSYTASVEFEGVTYENTHTVTYDALKHDIGEPTCTEGASCSRCDYTLDALGHTWDLTGEEPADCDSRAVYHYTCSVCGETDSVEQVEGSFVHAWEYTGDVAVEGIPCGYVKGYSCSSCGETKGVEYDEENNPTNIFYKHTYTAALTREATCTQTGEKTLTCACGHTTTEEVPVNPDAHTWGEGVKDEETGIITYTCTCGSTKTTVDATSSPVSKETLENTDELKLDNLNVSISMDDDTVNALGESVAVNVAIADESATSGLTEEQKDQIGDNPVYNFSMTSDDEEVSSFGGLVTISLPYTLQEGDDVDCIDVWFISDDGTVHIQQGTYSNGFVTFTTDHFSYYTVTQLTPAERCAHYGHNMVHHEKAATCASAGYAMDVCQRCGHEENSAVLPILEHSYSTTIINPTCTTNGMEEKLCANCGDVSRTTLFQLGHKMELTESVAATCTEAGKEVYCCANGECAHAQTVQLPALGHDHQFVETVDATCTSAGYDVYTCTHDNCGDTQHRNEQPAIGHDYQEAADAWTWSYDNAAATVTLVCRHDESHTTTQKAVVSEVIKDASCTVAGSATYTAKVIYNNVSYENVKHAEQAATGHATTSEEWQTTAAKHYRTCDSCGIRIEQADHLWGEPEISQAPTCVASGSSSRSCTICGYSRQETLPATGIHTDSDEDGSCDVCGFRAEICTHELTIERELDLSAYNVCEGTCIVEYSCECGQETDYAIYQLGCTFGDPTSTYEKELSGGYVAEIAVTPCQECGIVSESGLYSGEEEDTCGIIWIYYERLLIDGETIVEYEHEERWDDGHRPGQILEQKTITADGFCGAEILISECLCGNTIGDNSNYHCIWEYDEAIDKQVCTVCGATYSIIYSCEYDGCWEIGICDITLEYNGEILYTGQTSYRYEMHFYELDSYVMDGDSCADGVTMTYKCPECGDSYEEYTTYHWTDVREYIDLADWNNPCMVGAVQFTCPCGAEHQYHILFDGTCEFHDHSWSVIRQEGDTTVSACTNCGYTLTSVRSEGEKDENCRITVLNTNTISDGGEHSITLYRTESSSDHNFTEIRTLLGSSCEDGVQVVDYCKDCGYEEHSYTYYYHGGICIDSIDLSEFGGCDTQYGIYKCLCGQDTWLESTNECDWLYQDGGENYGIYTCDLCGINMREDHKHLGEENCITTELDTYTFSKNGRTLGVLSYTDTSSNHRYVYELTLHEDAVTCEDGYDLKGICVKCGNTYEDTNYYGHAIWTTDIITSPEGALCGTLVREIQNCACGKYTGSDTYWEGDSCSFYEYWDEEAQDWVEVCDTCGVRRDTTLQETIPGEEECSYIEKYNTSFFRDGQCIFSYEYESTYYDHDLVYSYQQEDGAKSCWDGYTLRSVCETCGEVWEDFGGNWYYGDCEARVTAKTLELSREDICGDVYREDWSCACGAYSFVNYDMSCSFVEDGYDEVTGAEKYRCENCGMRYEILEITAPVPGETCKKSVTRQVNYYVGDELLFSTESTNVLDNHTIVFGFELLGETCTDGYTTYNYCSKCGLVTWEDEEVCYDGCYESTYAIAIESIYDAGCGHAYVETYSCACGENTGTDLYSNCSFEQVSWDSESGNELHRCVDCGIERRITRTRELVDGTTCDYLVTWNNQFFDGEEMLGSYVSTDTDTSHLNKYIGTLLGDTCDDGYYARSECVRCGYVDWEGEELYYGCSSYGFWNYDKAYFEDADICGPVYEYINYCVCGRRYQTCLEPRSCDMQWVEVDGQEVYQCIQCGLTRTETSGVSAEDKVNCLVSDSYTQTFSLNGVQLGQYQAYNQWNSHTYLYSFELLGETCDDGYILTSTCYYCQKQEVYDDPNYDCSNWTVSLEPVVQRDDICGNVFFETNRCACGQEGYTNWYDDCDFESFYDEESSRYYHQCVECGLIRKYYSETVYDPENCTATELTHYTFYLNGSQCGAYTEEEVREYHTTSATFQMLGESCTDGYYATHSCRYCDYSRTDEALYTDHNTYETTVYDLSGLECCGVYISANSCPCGHSMYPNFSNDCDFECTDEYDPDGLPLYECTKCGLQYSEFDTDSFTDVASCTHTCNYNLRFYRDGELLQTVVTPNSGTSHDHVMTNVEFYDPEAGCAGGYEVTMQCPYCLDAYTISEEPEDTYHGCFPIDIFYVQALGGCDTTVYFYSCPCESRKYESWGGNACDFEYSYDSMVDSSGISHSLSTRTCSSCGFQITEDSYSLPTEDPCLRISYCDITLQYGNTVKVWREESEEAYHDDYIISAQLMEGSEDCYDGVYVTYGCTRCDYTETYEGSSHYSWVDAVYDLEEYGSVHGGELAHYLCACGETDRYDFRNLTCDLDQTWIENFIPGVIEDEWHYTADGSVYLDSEAYIFKCATTDPQCGLTVRMSEYWLADAATCTATEYQLWDLGYDEATDTYLLRVGPIAIREHTYHSYVRTDLDSTDEDGNYTYGYQDDCPVCGSYYMNKSIDYADGRHHQIVEAVNTLDDGETRNDYQHWYYDRVINGYRFETEHYTQYTRANGESLWYKDEYLYENQDDPCYYTLIQTNYQGDRNTSTGWNHNFSYSYEWINEPTCSQPGHELETQECQVCGTVEEEIYEYEPNGHGWYFDEDLNHYVCSRCSLENVNGADGNIILEDLSEGDRYIIGYYVRDDMEFIPQVEAVLYGQEENILLENINFTRLTYENDGITALSMSKTQVDDAVQAVIDGRSYEGEFAVKITFVPADDQSIMDYAITLDSHYTDGWIKSIEPTA